MRNPITTKISDTKKREPNKATTTSRLHSNKNINLKKTLMDLYSALEGAHVNEDRPIIIRIVSQDVQTHLAVVTSPVAPSILIPTLCEREDVEETFGSPAIKTRLFVRQHNLERNKDKDN